MSVINVMTSSAGWSRSRAQLKEADCCGCELAGNNTHTQPRTRTGGHTPALTGAHAGGHGAHTRTHPSTRIPAHTHTSQRTHTHPSAHSRIPAHAPAHTHARADAHSRTHPHGTSTHAQAARTLAPAPPLRARGENELGGRGLHWMAHQITPREETQEIRKCRGFADIFFSLKGFRHVLAV